MTVAEVPRPASLTGDEAGALLGYGWYGSEELARCREPLQPPELPALVDQLTHVD